MPKCSSFQGHINQLHVRLDCLASTYNRTFVPVCPLEYRFPLQGLIERCLPLCRRARGSAEHYRVHVECAEPPRFPHMGLHSRLWCSWNRLLIFIS